MKRKILILIIQTLLIVLIFNDCKKVPPPEFNEKEEKLISISYKFLPENIINLLKVNIKNSRNNPNYDVYIDSLLSATNRLYFILQEISLSKQNNQKSYSKYNNYLLDFKDIIDTFQKDLKNIYGSVQCGLKELGLGYGKGVIVDISAKTDITMIVGTNLTAHGGGGVEFVYDFLKMERAIFPLSICGMGGEISAGIRGEVVNCTLTDYVDWILGFNGIDGVKQYKGPAQSYHFNLSGSIKKLLGIHVGVDIGYWKGRESECNFLSIIECPSFNPANSTLYGITAGISSGIGGGVGFALALEAGTIGTCAFYLQETYNNFKLNEFGRIFASFLMACEILNQTPQKGFKSTKDTRIIDVIAAAVSITSGFLDPNQCQEPIKNQHILGEWKGTYTQYSYGSYPMIMKISNIVIDNFSGTIHWPTLRNSITTCEGFIKDDSFQWTEPTLLQGSNIVLNGIYKAKLLEKDYMSGKWNAPGNGFEGGRFEIKHK